MFFVLHPNHLLREPFLVPVRSVPAGEKLRVLLLMPPVDTGCPLQFSVPVLNTLVRDA